MSGTCAISRTSRRELSWRFFLPARQGAELEIHAILTETLASFLPGRAQDLSAPLYKHVERSAVTVYLTIWLWLTCITLWVNDQLDAQLLYITLTYLLTYLLTYSMVQSPSWAANRFAASQEIPRISRNPKVHYRTHKRPPPVSILGQPNPVHIPTSHLLEIHPNIIHPSTPGSPQWSLSLRFPHQDPIHPPCLH